MSTIYRNKTELKECLLSQLQAYKNLAIKIGLIPWALAFVGHFSYSICTTEAVALQLDEQFYKSFLFALSFGLIGYCIGGMISARLQHNRIKELNDDRERRKLKLEEQMNLRQSKLSALEKGL